MVAMHGALFLSMKTDGIQQQRVRRLAPILMVIFFAFNTVIVRADGRSIDEEILASYLERLWPIILPAGALAAVDCVLSHAAPGQGVSGLCGVRRR